MWEILSQSAKQLWTQGMLFSLLYLLVGCGGTTVNQRSAAESDLLGDWVMRPDGVAMLRMDVMRSGVPRIRIQRDGRLEVRSFPNRFGGPEPDDTADGPGKWRLNRGRDFDTLAIEYEWKGERSVALEIVVSSKGNVDLVNWLVERGEGALTFERISPTVTH
jgi:hypothetical protein